MSDGSLVGGVERAFDYLQDGGSVMWPLALATALAWYAIGYRFLVLNRRVLAEAREAVMPVAHSLRGHAGVDKDLVGAALGLSFGPFEDRLGRFRVLLSALVVAAPLLGLLGTVSGMMETFGSLGDGALHSVGGGIAAGVSEALITTQMGLAVAIPGLLVGRVLSRREDRLREKLGALRHEIAAWILSQPTVTAHTPGARP
jgi:biopolymer transport protein ExbB